ncbi:MAG: monovalent cation/H+ antiporter subunit D family protein [Parvibaculaceae bacterium]|nr:monovalent cation/H+ antiporter subunit D family protein [Parvibaculaceae bacterium]
MLSSLSAHMPVLQVIVLLIAAPLCALFGNRHLAWTIAFIAALAAFVISTFLLGSVLDGSVISYHLGGWAPPWGIEYRIDAANAFVLFIVSLIGVLVLPYARQSIEREFEASTHTYFYTCYLLCLTGLLGVAATGDAFNVFVFLEISSLATYALVAFGAKRDKRALTAAYNYLIMGTIGATFFVIGIGFLYMVTGTLNMADLAVRLAEVGDTRVTRVAFVFILVGMGLKLAMFPLHLWLPNAYSYAPSAITAFLAATATKVALYVLLRFTFTVFQFDFPVQELTFEYVVMPLALVAMFAASIAAVFQKDVKRLLAYSSVAQVGYMLLGVALLTEAGLTAGIIHLFNHAVTKGALFLAVGCFVYQIGSSRLGDLKGIGKTMPWTTAALTAGGLSLIGVPLTVGFISKWYLIQASLETGSLWIAGLIVASSLIAVVYVWRIVEVAYLEPAPEGRKAKEAPLSMILPTYALVAASLYFGINSELTSSAASQAAKALYSATDLAVPPMQLTPSDPPSEGAVQ